MPYQDVLRLDRYFDTLASQTSINADLSHVHDTKSYHTDGTLKVLRIQLLSGLTDFYIILHLFVCVAENQVELHFLFPYDSSSEKAPHDKAHLVLRTTIDFMFFVSILVFYLDIAKK